MEISELGDQEAEAVVDLWRACGLLAPHNDPFRDIAFCCGSGHGTVLVGRSEGRFVASVMVGHDGHRGWLYYVGTDPARRRQDLGRRIVAAAEEWLRGRGVAKAMLMIRDTNLPVRAFYRQLGYHEEPRAVMARWLDGRASPGPAPIEVAVTYLDMLARPGGARVPAPPLKLALLRAEQPTVPFYRFLYDTVGAPWLWNQRREMTDDTLVAIIRHEQVQVWVLHVGGVPAGFFELDARKQGVVDLALFGLMPEFIGRRIGPWLLDTAIHAAWDLRPLRVTVNTCTLDHPKALSLYQRQGFVPCGRVVTRIADPR